MVKKFIILEFMIMSFLSNLNLNSKDMINGLGIRFWFQLMENQNIRNIHQCQLIIRSLQDFVNVFSNSKENKKESISYNVINCVQDQSRIEDQNEVEVMVIVLVLGMKFWQNTIDKQNINDLKQCKVIINYLQKFISSMNFEDNEELNCGRRS